jgi:hypothetical protein
MVKKHVNLLLKVRLQSFSLKRRLSKPSLYIFLPPPPACGGVDHGTARCLAGGLGLRASSGTPSGAPLCP